MAITRKISTRSKLIILSVIFIILIGVVVIMNLPPSINYLTPNQVLSNQESYFNQSVTVKGYLDKNTEDLPIITNTMDVTNPGRSELKLDLSKIENRDKLIEGKQFYFTGIIKEDLINPTALVVYLELEKFESV